MRKKIISIIVLLIVGGLAYAVTTNYPKLSIVTSYAAKKMCSCTFIAERGQESIQNEDLALSLLSLSKTVIDREKKTATSTIFGMQAKTAEYRGKLGCVLVHGKDDYGIQFPESVSYSWILEPENFPYGDKIDIQPVQGVNYTKLNQAVDQAFDPGNEMVNLKTRSLLILHRRGSTSN